MLHYLVHMGSFQGDINLVVYLTFQAGMFFECASASFYELKKIKGRRKGKKINHDNLA